MKSANSTAGPGGVVVVVVDGGCVVELDPPPVDPDGFLAVVVVASVELPGPVDPPDLPVVVDLEPDANAVVEAFFFDDFFFDPFPLVDAVPPVDFFDPPLEARDERPAFEEPDDPDEPDELDGDPPRGPGVPPAVVAGASPGRST